MKINFRRSNDGLNLVDFQIIPHLNSEFFPKIRIENLKKASKSLNQIDGKKVYILDECKNSFVLLHNY